LAKSNLNPEQCVLKLYFFDSSPIFKEDFHVFRRIKSKNTDNFQQVAYYRVKRGKFFKPDNWVRRRGGGYDENLSAENREFLNKVVLDQFSNADSPLKEAPWKKGEFNPDSV
jgi:hypothetical protein